MFINYDTLFVTILIMIMFKYITTREKSILEKKYQIIYMKDLYKDMLSIIIGILLVQLLWSSFNNDFMIIM